MGLDGFSPGRGTKGLGIIVLSNEEPRDFLDSGKG